MHVNIIYTVKYYYTALMIIYTKYTHDDNIDD
jgi:hypothetical protein